MYNGARCDAVSCCNYPETIWNLRYNECNKVYTIIFTSISQTTKLSAQHVFQPPIFGRKIQLNRWTNDFRS